jgi:hypothetical protein
MPYDNQRQVAAEREKELVITAIQRFLADQQQKLRAAAFAPKRCTEVAGY